MKTWVKVLLLILLVAVFVMSIWSLVRNTRNMIINIESFNKYNEEIYAGFTRNNIMDVIQNVFSAISAIFFSICILNKGMLQKAKARVSFDVENYKTKLSIRRAEKKQRKIEKLKKKLEDEENR